MAAGVFRNVIHSCSVKEAFMLNICRQLEGYKNLDKQDSVLTEHARSVISACNNPARCRVSI